jgi:hypothetical protein
MWRYSLLVVCGCLLLLAGCGDDGGTSPGPTGSWEAMGQFDGPVDALVIYDGDLIAGGAFSHVGGVAISHLARWDGDSWEDVGGGVSGYELQGTDISFVRAMTVYDGKLIVAGYFKYAGGINAKRIAQWNGTSWDSLESGFSTDAILNGPNCVMVAGGGLVVGGGFSEAGGVSVNRIARWNGTAWSALGSGLIGLTLPSVDALAPHDGELVVGGSFSSAGGVLAANIATWDGAAWDSVDSGMMGGGVLSLVNYDGDLVAGGTFTGAGGVAAERIARWEGNSWSALGSGIAGSTVAMVRTLEVYDGDLIAGGYFGTAGGKAAIAIAVWDGSSWGALGSGLGGGQLGVTSANALVVFDGDLIVGGNFTSAGGKTAGFIAKWSSQ